MFPFLAPYLTRIWGPFRLLGSHLLLIGLGVTAGALIVACVLPRYWSRLPRDRGRLHVPGPEAARGKPTGAGFLIFVTLIPLLFLVMPLSLKLWQIVGCLFLSMLTGYLDDRSDRPWGEYRKGALDFGIALLTSYALCQGKPMTVWLPGLKGSFLVSPIAFLVMSTILLWMTVNATNCTDGVDGLAGVLTLLSLFYLGGFLYVVIGNVTSAGYLLVPHNPEGARWAILIFTVAGGLGGYLWHNAEPSRVLMGDAGSRFLGLLVGVAVLAAGNPFLIVVVAPVVLVNGGTGLFKIALLRLFRRLGFDVSPSPGRNGKPDVNGMVGALAQPHRLIVDMLHRVRFPLHDHCRKNLGWSNTQVLVRFALLQAFLTPMLLALLVKLR